MNGYNILRQVIRKMYIKGSFTEEVLLEMSHEG